MSKPNPPIAKGIEIHDEFQHRCQHSLATASLNRQENSLAFKQASQAHFTGTGTNLLSTHCLTDAYFQLKDARMYEQD